MNWRRIYTIHGFSLMEIIISLVLISLVATGLFAVTAHTRKISRMTEEKLIALTFADKQVAELREMGAKAIAVHPITHESIEVVPIPGILGPDATVTIHAKQPGEDNGVKEVVITVGWRDRLGVLRSESLAALIVQP